MSEAKRKRQPEKRAAGRVKVNEEKVLSRCGGVCCGAFRGGDGDIDI